MYPALIYPENITFCYGIAMLCVVFECFLIRIERKYKYETSIQLKIIRGLNRCMIGLGAGLNIIGFYLRYFALHSGPFTNLWLRGMDCLYLFVITGVFYLLVYLIGYI